jgi:hypothetical protein
MVAVQAKHMLPLMIGVLLQYWLQTQTDASCDYCIVTASAAAYHKHTLEAQTLMQLTDCCNVKQIAFARLLTNNQTG